MDRKNLALLTCGIVLVGGLIFIFHHTSSQNFSFFGKSGKKETEGPSGPPHYEATAVVKEVLDGDTILVEILEVLIPREGVENKIDKVRLAKIDVEETRVSDARGKHNSVKNMSQSEYEETDYYRHALYSKNLVEALLLEENKVYLDFDDLAGNWKPYRGKFGRLIAVVYAKPEEGWVNINAKVLRRGFPEHTLITSFKSEFEADRWLENDYPYL
ncbi:hypothetical protein AKJ64_02610 [candidate division MSBL1 archaeon SCGC-AAA259E17]|uniref:TNase-like domain-containing protein n=1 Tax=candidate division MSBL1 archaeon SCGC-AAA259E17 TaxID=1698263 RepID=A0A133UEK0_9EURY|nr:hypothetical protein AKJ64_02610 [candidate division MSBL1 archaeon SCGC-AAA259E17]